MKRTSLLLTALLLASGTAMAQTTTTLETIQVRPTTGGEIRFSCDAKVTPKPIDVEALLKINDRTQTQQLTNKLMGAVGEACARGVPSIVVERGKQGSSVIWYPVAHVTVETLPDYAVLNADGSITYPDGTTVYPAQ